MLLKDSVISKAVLILLCLSQFFKVNHLFSHIYRVGGVFIKSLVDQIINDAYESMASDIHITSSVNEGVVRFRVKGTMINRSEEHTSELQSRFDLVCRLLL